MRRALRGAIVGFGFIAERGHLAGYRATSGGPFEIIAVADGSPARRALAHELIPGVRTYASAEQLIGAEQHALDFVDVCVPPVQHAEVVRQALAAGLHVLCEKPLAVTSADARALVEAAQKAGRVLFPSHNYHHAPVVRKVRELLDAGVIGDVHQVQLHTFRTTHARGVADWQPDWRRAPHWSGGGIATDHGSHTFYLAFDWLGSYPTSVSASVEHDDGLATEDTVSCHVRFPTGVAVASMTWSSKARRTSYVLHGDRGTLFVNDDELEVVRPRDGKSESERYSVRSDWNDASHPEWFASLFERFAAATEQGDLVSKDVIDAVECVQLVEALYEAARLGKRVDLPRLEERLRIVS